MDRPILYAGQIPLFEQAMGFEQNAAVGLGSFVDAVMGNGIIVADQFAYTTSGFSVAIGQGSITSAGPLDPNGFGPVPSPILNTAIQYVFAGIATFLVQAGGTVTIYAQLVTVDVGAIVLPYYNANNPKQPFAGTNNSGTPQPTLRQNTVTLTAGTQSGGTNIPLYTVTVPSGASSITPAMVAQAAGSPFLLLKLPQVGELLTTSNYAVFGSSASWTVPANVYRVRGKAWGGGGGGGGSGNAGSSGTGGQGGLCVEFVITSLQPGMVIPITIGASGLGGVYNAQNSTAGTSTLIGNYVNAVGGAPGPSGAGQIAGSGAATLAGTVFGTNAGGDAWVGQVGGTGSGAGNALYGGTGGAAFESGSVGFVSSNSTTPIPGLSGAFPGQGGSGGVAGGNGGAGSKGFAKLWW